MMAFTKQNNIGTCLKSMHFTSHREKSVVQLEYGGIQNQFFFLQDITNYYKMFNWMQKSNEFDLPCF